MRKKAEIVFRKFLIWKARHLSQRQFILILSVVVGLLSGLVAVVLKNFAHLIQTWVSTGTFLQAFNPYYFLFPIVGIIITVLIKRLIRQKEMGEDIPAVLYSLSRKGARIEPHRTYSSLITSAFTVGFGGSVGLEGPTVGTGSAIGSNLARLTHLNFKSRALMIGCATAGAISSIFNAPIAAIIFTIEIFSLDLTFGSLIPLLLASVSGAVTSYFFSGNEHLFHFPIRDAFEVAHLPFYALLAVFTAFVSLFFTRTFLWLKEKFEGITKQYKRTLLGGLALGALVFVIPPLYGEGYETINNLLADNPEKVISRSFLTQYFEGPLLIVLLLVGLLLLKVLAASFTLSAGGVGGVFAPSLFVGATLGYVFAYSLGLLGIVELPASHFALAGMAGLMSGVLHSPLTGIFMIAEITGGYQLFVPFMLTSAVSYLVANSLYPHSIYTKLLTEKGDLLTHDKDQAVLTLMRVEQVIERDFVSVSPDDTLRQLVDAFSRSKRNLFPVLNKSNYLVGVLTLDDFKQLLFDHESYDTLKVGDLMVSPPGVIDLNQPMSRVIELFQETGAWNLPVLDRGRYIGFVSKSKLFSAYRRKLREMSV